MTGYNMPLHMQLAAYVCRRLLQGDWKAAEVLPDLRSLAAGFEVNTLIAEKTRDVLLQYGVIEAGNAGYVFTAQASDAARRLLRDDFTQNHVPYLSEQMQALGVSPEELAQMIQKHKLQS